MKMLIPKPVEPWPNEKENEVEQRSTHHPNLNTKKKHETTTAGFRLAKMCFAKTEAGFMLVNKTDQARVQFTSKPSVAQVVGDAKR